MSSNAETNHRPPLQTWQEVDQDIDHLARDLGMGSPFDAWVNAALDRLAEMGLPIPTQEEALAWADAEGRP